MARTLARLTTTRRPKQISGGRRDACFLLKGSVCGAQTTWLSKCLRHANIPEGDWFRRAQDRSQWRETLAEACPSYTLGKEQQKVLDEWRPGRPLPTNTPDNVSPSELEEEAGENGDEEEDADDAAQVRPGRKYMCWVCDQSFEAGNQLKFHYEEQHAVCDPALVTTPTFKCNSCFKHFPRVEIRNKHICPARQPI